jgi:hypothetical protein
MNRHLRCHPVGAPAGRHGPPASSRQALRGAASRQAVGLAPRGRFLRTTAHTTERPAYKSAPPKAPRRRGFERARSVPQPPRASSPRGVPSTRWGPRTAPKIGSRLVDEGGLARQATLGTCRPDKRETYQRAQAFRVIAANRGATSFAEPNARSGGTSYPREKNGVAARDRDAASRPPQNAERRETPGGESVSPGRGDVSSGSSACTRAPLWHLGRHGWSCRAETCRRGGVARGGPRGISEWPA